MGEGRRALPGALREERMREPVPSGRPQADEYASYAAADIAEVAGDDIVSILRQQALETLSLFGDLGEERIRGLTYAPGKWTMKEILGHLADDERIFAYRALTLARGDSAELPGFDENAYVRLAEFESRPLADLLAEYRSVRESSVSLFAGLPPSAWLRRGMVNGYSATVRGLAFHIAGHELHHHRVVRERYLAPTG
jgi:DinB superfamily